MTLLNIVQLTKAYGNLTACERITFDLYPGQVLGIVGESVSGKSIFFNSIGGDLFINAGDVVYTNSKNEVLNIKQLAEPQKRKLTKIEWGFVQQNPRDGLRMNVTAGTNIAERLLNVGVRHYGNIRYEAKYWLEQVEIDTNRMDDFPATFSGGMQQRLQLARVLVTKPRSIFMDEPTGGLDVSVQARLLDLLRSLVRNLNLSVILVTHDIGVVRLLAHRLLVMKDGKIVESGLTDRVLDDPQHFYTQQLVSSVLINN